MIKLKNVYKIYKIDDDNSFTALKNINLEIKKGELISILAPSGSGKSTLMHIIGLLAHPSKGKVFLNNKDVSYLDDNQLSKLRNKFIGFVFQQFNLINKLTVLENVVLPSIYSKEKFNFDPQKKALEILKRFGILEKKDAFPNKLSGGEQQRVAIARALIMSPEIVLADEPTGNLDSKSGDIILKLLEEVNLKDKKTVIIVTHEKEISQRTKRKIYLEDGKIVNKL